MLPTRSILTGASRGLGRALALSLARPGARLVLMARGADALDAVAVAARARGADVLAISADQGELSGLDGVAARALDFLGTPELLVLNASTLGAVPMPRLLDSSDDVLERTFRVNAVGPLALVRRLAPAMVLAGRGHVVGISSDAAVEAYPTWGPYGGSKAALDHLLAVLAAELDGSGVSVHAFDPGEMATDMHRDALPDADPATLRDPSDVAIALLAALDDPGPVRRSLGGAA